MKRFSHWKCYDEQNKLFGIEFQGFIDMGEKKILNLDFMSFKRLCGYQPVTASVSCLFLFFFNDLLTTHCSGHEDKYFEY